MIISSAGVVIEIGPGTRIITDQLARRGKLVLAIEKDPELSAMLRQKFSRHPYLSIRSGDLLSCPLPREPSNVFSNIPFDITSAILARLTAAVNPPEDSYWSCRKKPP